MQKSIMKGIKIVVSRKHNSLFSMNMPALHGGSLEITLNSLKENIFKKKRTKKPDGLKTIVFSILYL